MPEVRGKRLRKIYYASFEAQWLKKVFVASTERGICGVDFLKSEKEFLRRLKRRYPIQVIKDDQKNREALNQLKKYLEGKLKRFDCKLDYRGTPFQKKVWRALTQIPYGETRTYKEIARAIGHPKAFRAVGNANRQNPIPLIIPCHRVVESRGGLGGFGHGIKIKKRLLEFEKRNGI